MFEKGGQQWPPISITIMQILKDLVNRVMLLDERAILNQILISPIFQKWIIQMNQDQLFKEGINSSGVLLEDIGGQYSFATINGVPGKFPGKIELGLPSQWVTLFNEGDFYDSMKIVVENGGFEITVDPMKNGVSLFKRYGKEVLGCTEYFTSKAGHQMGGSVEIIESTESTWNGMVWCKRNGDLFFPTHWCKILQAPIRDSSCSNRKGKL